MADLEITHVPAAALRPYARNARTHTPKQIAQIGASIRAFGFNNPILIDRDGEIIAGHGRVAAAKMLGLDTVPCVRLEHLTEAQKRAYILADNKLAEKAGWDREILAIELQHLTEIDVDFDVTITGFEIGEIDLLLGTSQTGDTTADPADEVPAIPAGAAVTRRGDVWQMGSHRLSERSITAHEVFGIRDRHPAERPRRITPEEFERMMAATIDYQNRLKADPNAMP